ncbi:uncharacterized protein LOC144050794 [Vanacampus margaritifer]
MTCWDNSLKMCKVEMLRALLNRRLSAAVEEVVGVFARTIAEYEEELCRTKEENQRQRQQLDAVVKKQNVLHVTDISEENCHSEQQEWISRVEQQEQMPPNIKKEEKEDDITKMAFTYVPLQSEDEAKGENENNRGLEQPSSSSSHYMKTEADGDHCGGSHANIYLPPVSYGDNMSATCDEHSNNGTTSHIDNQVLTCRQYDKSFGFKPSLKCHLRTHTDNNDLKCPECDTTFPNQADLKGHMRIHTGEKPFSCSVCSKEFDHRGTLTAHMRTHTGERPFACSVCGQRFTVRSNMVKHMLIHTGEKPFVCSVCGRRVNQKSSLITHMRTHTGEKPFSCSSCRKSFSDRSSMIRHMRTHTGEKLFSCSVCDQRFSRKDKLNQHKCAKKKFS